MMPMKKRSECFQYADDTIRCYRDGFWYTEKGLIVKWCILAAIFFFFMAWFVGGYIHAKRRMKKGLPLLSYHRWLVPYNARSRYGQVPQNHFTFYATQPQPYGQTQYQQRADGTWPEPPPMYNQDAPPGYYAPPSTTKINPNQGSQGMEMPQYGHQMGGQQTGVVLGRTGPQVGDGETGQNGVLPERPETAKTKITNLVSRFRR